MAEEVQCEIGLWEELVTLEVGEIVGISGEDCKKIRFDGADVPFCCVVLVDVWWDKLEFSAPLFFNGQFVGFPGLVVQNL